MEYQPLIISEREQKFIDEWECYRKQLDDLLVTACRIPSNRIDRIHSSGFSLGVGKRQSGELRGPGCRLLS